VRVATRGVLYGLPAEPEHALSTALSAGGFYRATSVVRLVREPAPVGVPRWPNGFRVEPARSQAELAAAVAAASVDTVDLPELREAGDPAHALSAYAAAPDHKAVVGLILKRGTRPAGAIVIVDAERGRHIAFLGVVPDLRGAGLGPQLLVQALATASAGSPAQVSVELDGRNTSGIAVAVGQGFVAARTLEAAGIIAGVASILSLVTLRQSGVGAEGLLTGDALVSMYDRFFMLSQSLMPSINGILLGTLMYRSRLVPRILPTIGLIGAPILFVYTMLAVGGVVDNFGPAAGPAALLIAVWELSLGIYLTVKGFKPSPITDAFDAASLESAAAAKNAAFAR
jgi:ribosomal protein S18 acetylase RimI-like enzyme